MTKKNNHVIYLDYAATTPVDPRVLEAMLPYFGQTFGNPSSIHQHGQQAEAAIENARDVVAKIFNCLPAEIIFTSCGSESDNLALRGAALAGRHIRGANHILISPVEHHAVTHTAYQLRDYHGFIVEHIPVDEYGRVVPADLKKLIIPETAVVSVIYANNEIGTINPIQEIGAICRESGIPIHTDAVQAAAYLSLDITSLNVDLMAIGAHKFYGPKGSGALYIRQGTAIIPTQTGGGQEFGLRAGTSNVPYIVGLARALQLSDTEKSSRLEHIQPMRDYLIEEIMNEIPEVRLTGHPVQRLPNHASFVFHNVDGNALLMFLDLQGFACSSGSACKTGSPEPSEVLSALKISRDWALGSLRVTLGINTTMDDIKSFLDVLPDAIRRLRNLTN